MSLCLARHNHFDCNLPIGHAGPHKRLMFGETLAEWTISDWAPARCHYTYGTPEDTRCVKEHGHAGEHEFKHLMNIEAGKYYLTSSRTRLYAVGRIRSGGWIMETDDGSMVHYVSPSQCLTPWIEETQEEKDKQAMEDWLIVQRQYSTEGVWLAACAYARKETQG